MCQHNGRASAGDNTVQNTKDTHPIPGQKLKFLTPPGIEAGPPRWKQGLYRPRHGDDFYFKLVIVINIFKLIGML